MGGFGVVSQAGLFSEVDPQENYFMSAGSSVFFLQNGLLIFGMLPLFPRSTAVFVAICCFDEV